MKNFIYLFVVLLCILTNTMFAQWIKIDSSGSFFFTTIAAVDSNLVIANLTNIKSTKNNGLSWDTLLKSVGIWSFNTYGDKLLAGTNSMGIYYSSDKGKNWYNSGKNKLFQVTKIASNNNSIITINTPNEYTPSKVLSYSEDNGTNWKLPIARRMNVYTSNIVVIDNNYYALTEYGLYVSIDNGLSWNLIDEGMINNNVKAIISLDGKLYTGTGDGIYVSTDNGLKWNPLPTGFGNSPVVSITNSGQTIYAATVATIMYSTDYGKKWQLLENNEGLSNIKKIVACGAYLYVQNNDIDVWSRQINPITSVSAEDNIPASYTLMQNFPNPFNPETKIQYSIKKEGFVSLKVYNVLGAEVADIVNQVKAPGTYTAVFSGKNLSSGIYFYKLRCGNYEAINKMCLMK